MLPVLKLWFGVHERVGQASYAWSGFGLALLKYAVEALLIWSYAGVLFLPWQFINPLMSMRLDMLRGAPDWLGWALFIWSLPFLWIAISMSVRRAADANASPWLGLLVLVPLVNLFIMAVLCFLPPRGEAGWHPRHEKPRSDDLAKDAAIALGVSVIFGGIMLVCCVYFLSSYGGALFVGAPLLMGVVSAYLFNRNHPRSYGASLLIGLAAIVCGSAALLLFALEGVICVAMALPLTLPLGLVGGLLGKMIADSTRRPAHEVFAALLVLPGLAMIEAQVRPPDEQVVLSSVEINAPPETVWRHVIAFPDLAPADEWYFRLGIACPERARIEGSGVGAIRYCEFTTGTFVEPITVWEPGQRLAFDVTEQPAPMFELSPYEHVNPPHLEGFLRSNRGEFRLIALPDGRTRLEGRTWYELDIFPRAYWRFWTESIIHRIHHRVLEHVGELAEADR